MSDAEAQGLKIAVVGAGAAGMTAAHILQRRHEVTLFEREAAPGGHVKTIDIPDGPDAGTPVDTGFIVFNDDNYPLFNRLLGQLGVAARYSDMSFSYHSEPSGLQYSGTGINGLLAQRSNALRPRFWHLVRDVVRFGRRSRARLAADDLRDLTLGGYLDESGFGGAVADDYVIPLAAAVWSGSRDSVRASPAATVLRFFDNHGLLRVRGRRRWKTIVGGSQAYVRELVAGFAGEVVTGAEVLGVARTADGVTLRQADGSPRRFDRVVIAAHADQALQLLDDPRPEEAANLGAWSYNHSIACLHTDTSAMPPNRRAWAAWNYRRTSRSEARTPVVVTYHMNRLQGLRATADFFVSLNNEGDIDPSRLIARIPYAHPRLSRAAVSTQPAIARCSGAARIYYCGSYLGYGFHEDAVRSGVEVGRRFGLEL